MAPKTIVDVRLYACQEVDANRLVFALVPAAPTAKKGWYLRALDAESFETWRWALTEAGGGGESLHTSAAPQQQVHGQYGQSPLGHASSPRGVSKSTAI